MNQPLFYAIAQLKDRNALRSSASGGAAYGFGKTILERGGFIVGCVLGDGLLPVHIVSDAFTDLRAMQDSKYVQSTIESVTFRRINQLLAAGEKVLFVGTPCQVAGLYGYLGEDYGDLYTVDLICHGVASPGVFSHYIKEKAHELGGEVVGVRFRCKEVAPHPNNRSLHLDVKSDCSASYHLGKTRTPIEEHCLSALSDPYGSAYYHNRILRESCYRCHYAQRRRIGDITVGDYGGVPTDAFVPGEGCSFVGVNTAKGRVLLEMAKELLVVSPIEMNYTQVNLRQPTLRPKSRDKMRTIECVPGDCPTELGGILGVTIVDRLKNKLPASLKDFVKVVIRKVEGA